MIDCASDYEGRLGEIIFVCAILFLFRRVAADVKNYMHANRLGSPPHKYSTMQLLSKLFKTILFAILLSVLF